jgi:hypothetical protein
MDRSGQWQGSGNQFVSSSHREWREECCHDQTSAAKSCSSQQKHWPNEIRQFHPETKFPRNATVRDTRLKGCDSTRLGPVRDRNPQIPAQLDARTRENERCYALRVVDSCHLRVESAAIGGFCSVGRSGRWPVRSLKTRNRTPTPPSRVEFEGHEAFGRGKCRIIDWFGCSWLAVDGLDGRGHGQNRARWSFRWPWCS